MPDSSRPKRPRVIVTRQLMPHVEARMAELFDVALSAHDHAFTKDELKAAVADCDVLVPTVTDTIDAEVIAAAGERLKLIANFGAGSIISTLPRRAQRASWCRTRRGSLPKTPPT